MIRTCIPTSAIQNRLLDREFAFENKVKIVSIVLTNSSPIRAVFEIRTIVNPFPSRVDLNENDCVYESI